MKQKMQELGFIKKMEYIISELTIKKNKIIQWDCIYVFDNAKHIFKKQIKLFH